MREAHRSFRATRQKRQKIDPRARSKPLGAPLALERLTGKVLERLRGGPGTLLDGSWPLLARLGRPKIGFGAAFGHPKAIPSASGHVPETALGTQNGPRSIFRRFGVDFHRFFVDFRSSRVRRRHKSRISKRSRVILSARLGSCIVQSLRTARTSFEMTFEHCMFSLFSLRSHKLT